MEGILRMVCIGTEFVGTACNAGIKFLKATKVVCSTVITIADSGIQFLNDIKSSVDN